MAFTAAFINDFMKDLQSIRKSVFKIIDVRMTTKSTNQFICHLWTMAQTDKWDWETMPFCSMIQKNYLNLVFNEFDKFNAYDFNID